MITNFDEFIVETVVNQNDIDTNQPVMFSIYGDFKGPWYFGYKLKGEQNGVVGAGQGGVNSVTYAKLIVDFDKFDPKNLKNNEKHNIAQ